MIWVLVIVAVIIIYNAERMPELMDKFKKEVPNLVDTGKKVSEKVSKELKEKAQAAAEKKISKNKEKE